MTTFISVCRKTYKNNLTKNIFRSGHDYHKPNIQQIYNFVATTHESYEIKRLHTMGHTAYFNIREDNHNSIIIFKNLRRP